jgi:hypothetical protein
MDIEGSREIGGLKGYAKEEYPHKESSLETDASMLNVDDEASMQA